MLTDTTSITAVIDTNVGLSIVSQHDMSNAIVKLIERDGRASVTSPEVVFRRNLARDSILLAVHLHQIGAVTYSIQHELMGKVIEKVTPAEKGSTVITPEADFTTLVAHFILDHVLPGWQFRVHNTAKSERGTDIDTRLLNFAQAESKPLITNEGITPEGVKDKGLRRRAMDARVPVFTPREFWQGKLDEREATDLFFRRFDEELPKYSNASATRQLDGKRYSAMAVHRNYYWFVLTGENEGLPPPLD